MWEVPFWLGNRLHCQPVGELPMVVKSCNERKDLKLVGGSKEKWSVIVIKGLKVASLAVEDLCVALTEGVELLFRQVEWVVGVGAKWYSQAVLLLEFYGHFCGISDFVWIVSIDVTCNLCHFKVSHFSFLPPLSYFCHILVILQTSPAKLLALPCIYCSELTCGLAPWFAHWQIRMQLCTVHWLLNLYKGCLITPTFICPEYDNWHVWWNIRKSSFLYVA
jgi:hypothetical protein